MKKMDRILVTIDMAWRKIFIKSQKLIFLSHEVKDPLKISQKLKMQVILALLIKFYFSLILRRFCRCGANWVVLKLRGATKLQRHPTDPHLQKLLGIKEK
jgi:hypothetical protein